MSTKYIAVTDETGGSRPIDRDDGSFGVGTLIYPAKCEDAILNTADTIASIVGKKDFKFKDVQNSNEARIAFLDMLNSSRAPVLVYSFYSSGRGIAREFERFDIASEHYGSPDRKIDCPNKTRTTAELLHDFVGKMACQLGAYAVTTDSTISCFWDRRNDLDALNSTWNKACPVETILTSCWDGAAIGG